MAWTLSKEVFHKRNPNSFEITQPGKSTVAPLHQYTSLPYKVLFQFWRYWAMYWDAGVSVPEFRRLMAERAKVVPARQAA
jgi:hypothetical protein